jgi:hypothetical protein
MICRDTISSMYKIFPMPEEEDELRVDLQQL